MFIESLLEQLLVSVYSYINKLYPIFNKDGSKTDDKILFKKYCPPDGIAWFNKNGLLLLQYSLFMPNNCTEGCGYIVISIDAESEQPIWDHC